MPTQKVRYCGKTMKRVRRCPKAKAFNYSLTKQLPFGIKATGSFDPTTFNAQISAMKSIPLIARQLRITFAIEGMEPVAN